MEVHQNLRSRAPTTHAGRPEVTITGDGSVGGTNLAFHGIERPGDVTRIQIDLDAHKPNQLAAGKVFYTTEEGAGVLDVWVRFGS